MLDPQISTTQPASPPLMSVDDFASKIKAKYPDYAGIDNATLAQKIIAKHPEYASQVNTSAQKSMTGSPALDSVANAGVKAMAAPKQPSFMDQLSEGTPNPVGRSFGDSVLDAVKEATYHPQGFKVLSNIAKMLGHAGESQAQDITHQGETGQISPTVAGVLSFPGHALGTIGRIGQGVSTPENAALAAASLHPVTRIPAAAIGAAMGGKSMFDSLQGPMTADKLENLLLGGSAVAGSVAGAGSGIKESGVGNFLAKKTVAPLVKQPLNSVTSDIKYGRSASSAIVDEGLTGTKAGLIDDLKTRQPGKIQNRISELSDATDKQLQNHPNANVQIDAEPIIDKAINDAQTAAKQRGQASIVQSLEDLRNGLKTQYGPIKANPATINKFKTKVGQVGSDLGAFKGDPAQASAAAAMEDVYTGLKNAVNAQVPEVAPLNERVSNLISAKKALTRNTLKEEGKGFLSGMSLTNAPFKIADKVTGSAPVRTGLARILNAGNTLDVPDIATVPPVAQTPVKGLLNAPAIQLPSQMQPIQNVGPMAQPAAKGLPARGAGGRMQKTYTSSSTFQRPPIQTVQPAEPEILPPSPKPGARSFGSPPSDFKINASENFSGTDLTMKDARGNTMGSVGMRDSESIGGKPVSEIGDIQLNAQNQGKGYGQALYEEAAKHAKANGDGFLVSSGKPTASAQSAWQRLQAAHPQEIKFINGRWMWRLN